MKPFTARQLSDGVKSVSDTLSDAITSGVSKAVAPKLRAIERALRDEDFQEAKALVRELKFTDAVREQRPATRKFARASAMVGTAAIDNPKTSLWANGAPFPIEVDERSPRLIENMVIRALERETMRRIEDRVDRASRFQKAEPIDPSKLATQINRFLRGEIRRVVDVSANIVGTRVASYGMLHEARARGITRYRIDAVLDERTTDICRSMDGRQFEVEQAFVRTQQIISVTDPSALKKMAPFPTSEGVKIASSEQLQAQGHDVPPFHFLCRSVITLIDARTEYDSVPVERMPDNPEPMSDTQIDRFVAKHRDKTRAALRMADDADFEDLYERAFAEVDIDFPDETLNRAVALQAYAGNSYVRINDTLRTRSMWSSEEMREMTRKLDNTFKDLPEVGDDTVVYRGVGKAVLDELSKVGAVFQDDGFMSTTFSASLPPQFHRDGGGLLQIMVPKNQKALVMNEISQLSAENEMLLPRGMQLRVVGFQKATIDGREVTMVRVVAQGVGRTVDIDNITDMDAYLDSLESVVKLDAGRFSEKFAYTSTNDLIKVAS